MSDDYSHIKKIYRNYLESIANARERYDVTFGLLSELANIEGFEIYNKNLSWIVDLEFNNIWKKSQFFGKQRADRKFLLFQLAKSAARLPGHTVELGVLDGASSFLIMKALEVAGDGASLHHGFDSFEGLSQPTLEDLTGSAHAYRWSAGDLCIEEEIAVSNLCTFRNLKLYKGWIPDRFNEVAHINFSLVHIDVDLYKPTQQSLEFFYPCLVSGGVLICDDYGYETCPGARKALDEYFSKHNLGGLIHLPTGQAIAFKP